MLFVSIPLKGMAVSSIICFQHTRCGILPNGMVADMDSRPFQSFDIYERLGEMGIAREEEDPNVGGEKFRREDVWRSFGKV